LTITVLTENTFARERSTTGAVFQDTATIGDVSGSGWHLGLTFNAVPAGMVQGIKINRARLKYTDAIDRLGSSISQTVSMERSASPANMGTSTNNVSARTRTTAQVLTAFTDYPSTGPYMLKDITGPVQELFDDFNPSGNQLAMIFFYNSSSTDHFIEFGAGGTTTTEIEIDWEALAPGGGGGPQQQSILSLVGGYLAN